MYEWNFQKTRLSSKLKCQSTPQRLTDWLLHLQFAGHQQWIYSHKSLSPNEARCFAHFPPPRGYRQRRLIGGPPPSVSTG